MTFKTQTVNIRHMVRQFQKMFNSWKFSSIVLILLSEIKCDSPKTIEDYTYIFLMVVSPKHVPGQKNLVLCSAIMLVEDCFYLTAESCFDNVIHDKRVKIAMSRRNVPRFDILIYEDFIMKSRDLQDFVVLQKDGIELVIEKNLPKGASDHVIKNPYLTDDLLEPRVLLAHPDNPSFTHCYCLGWGSFAKKYQDLSKLKLKFTASSVESTTLRTAQQILVEREEHNIVEDYGSTLLCEVKPGGEMKVRAVVGIFTGGDHKVDSMEIGLVTYRSFSDTLRPLTRWAIGTNVSISGNLSDWTLWPFHRRLQRPEVPILETKSTADYLSEYKYLYELSGVYLVQYIWKNYT